MLYRIWMVARRELLTTISSKGFLFGVLMMPLLVLALVALVPRFMGSAPSAVRGNIAVIDPTGRVLPELQVALDPEEVAAREARDRARAELKAGESESPQLDEPQKSFPILEVLDRSSAADVEAEKASLIGTEEREARNLALIVVHADAAIRNEGKEDYGTYDLYVSEGLSDEAESFLHESLRQALIAARLRVSGLDPQTIETQMRVERPQSVVVSASGEQASQRWLKHLLPFVAGLLLFMGVIMGGQTLMTSTIEEKSSRVVEVLLSALRPIELMWGKLLGQLAVGLIVLAIYVGTGFLSLTHFALTGLLDPALVGYLIVFYLIAYLVYGALMLAIGAAVNQMADAQGLMGPVMLLLVAPYALTPMIGQAPNAPFSVIASFIPPFNTFAILARLASDVPPPAWQVWLSALVGLGSAVLTVWFAAKVFRIGLLLHGKPPSFATLIKWVRMA